MHIERISVKGIPPISRPISLDCDQRVNLLVGPNASGKSTILRVIEHLHSSKQENLVAQLLNEDLDNLAKEDRPLIGMTASADWPRRKSGNCQGVQGPIWSQVPLLFIPATRASLAVEPEALVGEDPIGLVQDARGGVNLEVELGGDCGGVSGVFDSQWVAHSILGLLQIRVALAQRVRNQLENVIQAGYSCARSICREVIRDYSPHPYVELNEWAARQDDLTVYASMGIGTTDDFYGSKAPLYVGSLSAGTQGTIIWIWCLALKMAQHYDWKVGWEKEPAILLIDEVENHLHPTWQRRVIPALLEQFPRLQIFATTHSPFVVAGLRAGQVHLLSRAIGGISATTYSEDVIGWTMDEILRTMMGVDDPTDDATAAAARELRELRKEGPRANERAEEQRQRRMDKLRQTVNRELLAGGPEAAQREDFEKQFAEALQRYRESHNLNQDNG